MRGEPGLLSTLHSKGAQTGRSLGSLNPGPKAPGFLTTYPGMRIFFFIIAGRMAYIIEMIAGWPNGRFVE